MSNSSEVILLILTIAILLRIDYIFLGIYYVMRFLGLTKL